MDRLQMAILNPICLFLQAKAYNFTKRNTPPWVFSTFFTLPKYYQIAQRISSMMGLFYKKNITAKYVPGHGRFQQCIIF